MAKYIIDIPEKGKAYYTTSDLRPYTASESYIDGLKKGRKEVWEFARKIDNMVPDEIQEAFTNEGNFVWPFSLENYQEAKIKYEEWKAKNADIHVGDEVIYHGNKYVVCYVGADEVYHIVDRNWIRQVVQGDYQIFKTGRHFPEVAELLKKMREE